MNTDETQILGSREGREGGEGNLPFSAFANFAVFARPIPQSAGLAMQTALTMLLLTELGKSLFGDFYKYAAPTALIMKALDN